MESGLFNNIIRIDNRILKISKRDNTITNQVMEELNSRTPEEYASDISTLGIKTARIIYSYNCSDYNILIQEYIDGRTVQELLCDAGVGITEKIRAFEKLIDIYAKSLMNDNLCLDWNMKNFIVKDDEIYYVDLTPSLYKDKIRKSQSDNLKQYRDSYLDKNIQVAGILGYAIMPFLDYKTKSEATIIFKKFNSIIEEKLGLCLDTRNINHVYLYKLTQINQYLFSNLSFDEMKENISSYSMEEISKYPKNHTSPVPRKT